jgi:hypothetical protein
MPVADVSKLLLSSPLFRNQQTGGPSWLGYQIADAGGEILSVRAGEGTLKDAFEVDRYANGRPALNNLDVFVDVGRRKTMVSVPRTARPEITIGKAHPRGPLRLMASPPPATGFGGAGLSGFERLQVFGNVTAQTYGPMAAGMALSMADDWSGGRIYQNWRGYVLDPLNQAGSAVGSFVQTASWNVLAGLAAFHPLVDDATYDELRVRAGWIER